MGVFLTAGGRGTCEYRTCVLRSDTVLCHVTDEPWHSHSIIATVGAQTLLDGKGCCGTPVKDSPDVVKIEKYPEYFKFTHTKFKEN